MQVPLKADSPQPEPAYWHVGAVSYSEHTLESSEHRILSAGSSQHQLPAAHDTLGKLESGRLVQESLRLTLDPALCK